MNITLLWNERQIVGNVASQVAGENPCLHKGNLPDTNLLAEQRVVERFLFAFLIGLDNELPPLVREFNGASFPVFKISGANLLAIDERDGETIREPGAKLFHQIERQRRAVGPVRVEKADEWIEANRRQRGETIIPHEGVEK